MRHLIFLIAVITACNPSSSSKITDAGPAAETATEAVQPAKPPRMLDRVFYDEQRARERQNGLKALTPPERYKPVTFAASGARPPIVPASWTTTTWYLDPNNASSAASDSNTCTSAGSPCLTWKEIYNGRWGCVGLAQQGCPAFPQSMTVNVLSTQPSNGESDPVGFCPAWRNGAQIQITGVLNATTQVSTGTITVTQAFSRTANPGQTLQYNVSGAAMVGGANLVSNTGHASLSTIYDLPGSVGPYTANSPINGSTVTSSYPTEVTGWTTSDPYTGYAPAGLNIVKLCGTVVDVVSTPMIVNQLTFLNSEASHTSGTFQIVNIDGPVIVADSIMNRKVLTLDAGGQYPATRFVDDQFNMNGQWQGLAPTSTSSTITPNGDSAAIPYPTLVQIWGGAGFDQPDTGECSMTNVWVDYDFRNEKGGIGCTYWGLNLYGGLFIENSGFLNIYDYMMPISSITATPTVWTDGAGAGTIYVQGRSRFVYKTNATTTFQGTVALRGNGRVSTMCSHTNTNPDFTYCGNTVNPTNLDSAAVDAGGFNGLAFLPGGASFALTQ